MNMEITLPEQLSVQVRGSHLEITRRWFSLSVIFISFFAIAWDIFLLVWYGALLHQGNASLLKSLFPLLHIALGVGVSYFALAGWLNHTSILVSPDELRIRHAPLPWFGGQTLQSPSLQQLYSKEVVSYSRNGRTVHYDLRAITHDGRNIKLLSGLESSQQALYIEQQVEKYLCIRNENVAGEIGYQNQLTTFSN